MSTAIEAPSLLNRRDAAAFLGVSGAYLRQLELKRRGPKFFRLGRGAIRYRLDDLERFRDENTFDPGESR